MKMKQLKQMMCILLVISMMLSFIGCSSNGNKTSETGSTNTSGTAKTNAGSDEAISADSPYKGLGLDLSKPVTLEFYMVGSEPADVDKVMDKLNKEYLQPYLNTTLEVNFIAFADVSTKYTLLLTGADQCDLIYASSWLYYNDQAVKGAYKELTDDFMKTYMPNVSASADPISWDQMKIGGKIYGIPKQQASFNDYTMVGARTDLMQKYGYSTLSSYDDLINFLKTIAEKETPSSGIYAVGQRGFTELEDLYFQNLGCESLATDQSFYYYHNNSEEAPDWSKVFYEFTSEEFHQYVLQMADLAKAGCWSSTLLNEQPDVNQSFINGLLATFIWNSTVVTTGDQMEAAGAGTYDIFDVTPNKNAQRGSYAADATSISAQSKYPERAALVMDFLLSNPEANKLVIGGIEGEHYKLDENGDYIPLDASANYLWNSWTWALNIPSTPVQSSTNTRMKFYNSTCEAKEFNPVAKGFTFDKNQVATTFTTVQAVLTEYLDCLRLGYYGDETEKYWQMFQKDLKNAGVDELINEVKKQWEDYCKTEGY